MAAHRPASRTILKGIHFEPLTHAVIERFFDLRDGGNMLHAGAFFGDMLPSFSAKCPGTIYAFEPVLESYILAQTCIRQNGLENIALYNSGVSKSVGLSRIRTHKAGKSVGGGAAIKPDGDTLITTVTIDSLNLNQLSILQLDLEGHERMALEGAKQTIDRCKPIVMLENKRKRPARFMLERGYVFAGTLPGQNIWSRPRESEDIAAIINEVSRMA